MRTRNRALSSGILALGVVLFAACSRETVTSPSRASVAGAPSTVISGLGGAVASFTIGTVFPPGGAPEPGVFKVCTIWDGGGGPTTVTLVSGAPSSTLIITQTAVRLGDGECATVATSTRSSGPDDVVTLTETFSALSEEEGAFSMSDVGPMTYGPGTISLGFRVFHGATVLFTNRQLPPPQKIFPHGGAPEPGVFKVCKVWNGVAGPATRINVFGTPSNTLFLTKTSVSLANGECASVATSTRSGAGDDVVTLTETLPAGSEEVGAFSMNGAGSLAGGPGTISLEFRMFHGATVMFTNKMTPGIQSWTHFRHP